jgi:hypothetical protein
LSAADCIGPFAGAGLTEECAQQFELLMEIGKHANIGFTLSVRYWQR